MPFSENKDFVERQILEAKARLLDISTESDDLKNKLRGLYGAFETISFLEKKQDEQPEQQQWGSVRLNGAELGDLVWAMMSEDCIQPDADLNRRSLHAWKGYKQVHSMRSWIATGQEPLNLSTALQNLDSTCRISGEISDLGLIKYTGGILFSSAQPSYPAAANYHSSIHVGQITKVAGSYEGWLNVSGVWKTYGSVSA